MVQKIAVGLAVFGFLALFLPLICVFAAHRRWRASRRSLEQSPTMEELVRGPSTAASDAMTRVGTDDALKPLMPHTSSENAPDDVASSSKRTSTLVSEPDSPPQLPKLPTLKTLAMGQLSAEFNRPAISRSVSAIDETKSRPPQPRRATFGSGLVGATAALSHPSATAVGRALAD